MENTQLDKYEIEFSKAIKESAKKIKVDRFELGELRLKRLAAMLYLLIKEKNETYDLLVAGGNSGVATMEITKMVYHKAGIALPPTALFPVIRPSQKEHLQNIKINKKLIQEQLNGIKNVKRVLFIDDEIMRGQTAKVCFEHIRDYLKISHCLNCTIVAENHFFVWRHDLDNISVRFLPFAMVLQGYNCNFGYLMPKEVTNELEQEMGTPLNRNKALAVLLGGKVKLIKNKTSLFDTNLETELQNKIKNYNTYKNNFQDYVKKLVHEGIDEFKNKKITLRYHP